MVTFFNISLIFVSEFFVSILRIDKEKPTKKNDLVFPLAYSVLLNWTVFTRNINLASEIMENYDDLPGVNILS